MKKKVIGALLALSLQGLTGCTSTGGYGNYATAPLHFNQKMAQDTAAQLVTLYLPAKTHLSLKQRIPPRDTYGTALVEALRANGYSVLEYTPQKRATRSQSTRFQPSAIKAPVPTIDLRYIVDAPKSTNFYRVTVQVGTGSISRVFTLAPEGKLYPASAWIRRE
ncbi:conjugal transfer protein TrbH [Candidatus Regiella endosymbiont of Tuberolachnus salignus]|uniref:conjugal transfer protein TrbH n=1 Tax=Candidatus Regiella endosymbiont of Tuberolachnus salignus TaxID=3077956 RepID=UPI0030D2BAA6